MRNIRLSDSASKTASDVGAILKAPLLYLVLTTHIPHCETNVLVLNSLHVKPCKAQAKCNFK